MSGYGMKFTTEGTAGQWSMVVNSCGNIALRNIEFDGKGQENCLYVKNGVPRPSNIIVSRCYLHDANNPIAAANSYNILLEYSRILRNWSSPTHHGQGFVLWSADRVCVRYNIFGDIVGTAYIAGAWGNDDWQIYGNVFYRSPGYAKGVGTGAIVDISVPPETGAQNWKIYNNLFINLGNLNVGISIDVSRGGNEAYNNIWYNCSASAIRFKNIIHDYNYFYNNEITSNGVTDAQLAASELHGQLGTEDPLVDWQNGDFRPVMATDPGLDVCSLPGVNCAETPFNIDMFGNIRGADGVWDRGAAEFIAGTDYPPIVRSATLENLTTLRVVFSEALEPVSAANISNYSVDQGVVVQSAAVDDRTVTLTLSGARYDTVYTLTVNNLRDLTGNVIAPDSQKQFSRENIIDNADARGVTVSAGWIVSTYNAGRYGANYVHDDNTGKGTKSVTFIPDLSEAGSYEVYMWYPASSGYATNVPVDIAHRGGTDTVTVNEQLNGSKWNLLGVYDFEARSTGHVRIRTDGTDGYVIADAVKFVKVALPGDANLDGAVNIADAIAVAKYCVGISLPKFDAKNADVDCNPGVTINDAITIAKYVVRAIQEWPDCGG